MAITETWLRLGTLDDTVVGNITPNGYTMLHKPRQTGKGGGVGVILRDAMNAKVEPINDTYKSFEYIQIKATSGSFTYRFFTIRFGRLSRMS